MFFNLLTWRYHYTLYRADYIFEYILSCKLGGHETEK